MARETKVGLLAGLAFVICFAVILANRGGEQTAHGTMSNFSAVDVPSTVQRTAARNSAPARGRESSHRPASDPGATRVPQPRNSIPSRNSIAENAPAPSSGAELVFDAQRDASTLAVPLNSNARPLPASPHPRIDQHDANEARRPSDVELEVPRHGAPMNERSSPQQAYAPMEKPEPSNIGQVSAIQAKLADYTVESGDTLSKIALKQYGSKSKAGIQAIFEANRNSLSSPDSVRAGMTLVIPRLDSPAAHRTKTAPPSPTLTESAQSHEKAADASHGKSQGRNEAEHKTAEASVSEKFRWYQIKKNDRYVNIARNQLGDGDRWHEIYELNKDKFPDPGQIREGVRIKLPSTASAALEATH